MRSDLTNAWSTANDLEVQRQDLWHIDLAQPAAALNRLLGAQQSATAQSINACTAALSFPTQEIEGGTFMSGATPGQMPGRVKSLDVVRLDILLDRRSVRDAHVLAFFVNWRNLARVGREGSGRWALPLPDASSVITHAFDIQVRLEGGIDPNGAPVSKLPIGATYTLVGAWVKGLQHNAIDRTAQAAAHTYSVLLQVNQIKT